MQHLGGLGDLGYLLFKTHGTVSKKVWWIAQIGIWSSSAVIFWIYREIGIHDALMTSVIWLVFFWWKTNINIKRLQERGSHGWRMFLFLVWCEVPVFGWLTGFFVMGILGEKREKKHILLR